VTGSASLNETLNLPLINTFTPVVGQTFTILNAPSGITGTFSTEKGLSISSSEQLQPLLHRDHRGDRRGVRRVMRSVNMHSVFICSK